jgi:ligand-binding sensor domain-containing protein/two-component sensor histidine kinase
MKFRLYLSILLSAISLLTVKAQKHYLFHSYNTRDGLPNNTIFAINQDKKGYIWFGTDAGVSRFDGYQFNNHVIPAINDNATFVECIEKDNDGYLLITSFMQGVHVEQPDGSFRQYLFEPIKIGKNGPKTIKVCRDGRILVSHSNFLNLLIRDQFKFKRILRWGVIKNIVATIDCDQKNNIWFGGFYGLAVIKAGDTTYKPYFLPELKDIFINKILFDRDQNLLVATNQGYYKIIIEHNSVGSLKYKVVCPLPMLKDMPIIHVMIDRQNNVWFSTSTNGVYKTHHDTLLEHLTTGNGLLADCVYCAFEDREGNYWFGTSSGVCKLSGFDKYSFSYQDKPVSGFDNIAKDQNGRIWLSDGTILFVIHGNSFKKFEMTGTALGTGGIYKMFVSGSRLLIANHLGLYSLPLENKDINIHLLKKIANFTSIGANRFKMMNEDREGNIWIGFDNGLYVYRNGKFNKCQIQDTLAAEMRPFRIVQDKFGFYWIGDFIYGLYRMSLVKKPDGTVEFNHVKVYKSLKPDSAFVNAWIQDVAIDNGGNLWQSTLYSGVYKLRIDRNGVIDAKLFSVKNGLSSNNVTGITEDCYHNLWFATQNGADRMTLNSAGTESFQHFNSTNGLGNEVYQILPDSSTIYISYSEGFYALDMNRYNHCHDTTSKVFISSISVMGRIDSAALHANTPYKLHYNQNLISFDYTSISFRYENGILYQYMLEGLDDSWGDFTDRRYISYNSLPPGKYTFKVRVKSVNGIVSKQIATFAFVIRPPIYKTWWFLLLSAITLILIASLAYQYRVKQLLKVERLRTRIATDLHDDIGSTLSSISILSEIMSSQIEDNPKFADMIRKIGFNARNMLESMDDIIWAVNPSNDKFQNLGLRIREYAIPLFESKNIKFQIHFSEQLTLMHLPMDIRRNVYLIAKEAINNLVKYSECGQAEIECMEQHPYMVLKVQDYGKGFDPCASTSRNGLKNMQRRAEQIKAKLEVVSTPGKGSSIVLQVKIS